MRHFYDIVIVLYCIVLYCIYVSGSESVDLYVLVVLY